MPMMNNWSHIDVRRAPDQTMGVLRPIPMLHHNVLNPIVGVGVRVTEREKKTTGEWLPALFIEQEEGKKVNFCSLVALFI